MEDQDRRLRFSHGVVVATMLDDSGVVLLSGAGDSRAGHELRFPENKAAQFWSWLLRIGEGTTTVQASTSAMTELGVSHADASSILSWLEDSEILVSEEDPRIERRRAQWARRGWREPADFEIATSGFSFVPDDAAGNTYRKLYSELLADPNYAEGQPAHYAPRTSDSRISFPYVPLSPTLSTETVLDSARPVNRFIGPVPEATQIISGLVDALSVQRMVGGSLGPHQNRSYPSGGARHPFEAYILATRSEILPGGVSWFDPLTKELVQLGRGLTREQVEDACFAKGGIVSASCVVVFTCRWIRHAWKYRYSRSYRMVLLELGHLIQSVNLAMRSRGIDVYQCPSFDDAEWADMLGISDDAEEAVLYVLGLGTSGRL